MVTSVTTRKTGWSCIGQVQCVRLAVPPWTHPKASPETGWQGPAGHQLLQRFGVSGSFLRGPAERRTRSAWLRLCTNAAVGMGQESGWLRGTHALSLPLATSACYLIDVLENISENIPRGKEKEKEKKKTSHLDSDPL